MSAIETFLQSLHDVELAFLYKYKYPGYFDRSKNAVLQELARRSLTAEKMNSYVERYEFNESNTGCPRCNSGAAIVQEVELTNTGRSQGMDGLQGRASYTNTAECAVCGYKLYDGNEGIPSSYIWAAFKRLIGWKKK